MSLHDWYLSVALVAVLLANWFLQRKIVRLEDRFDSERTARCDGDIDLGRKIRSLDAVVCDVAVAAGMRYEQTKPGRWVKEPNVGAPFLHTECCFQRPKKK